MVQKLKTLEELKRRSLGESLPEVGCRQETSTVVLEEGELITIRTAARLKPLLN
jgi:hypothetical protein